MVTRRSFLYFAAGSSAAVILPSFTPEQKKANPPALPIDLVKESVGAGHCNLEKTKTMLGNAAASKVQRKL